MKLNRIGAVVIRHAYEARRNIDRITDMVYWPILDIVVWGFFTIYLARGNRMQPGVVNFLLGAVILWGLFYAFQRDMAVGFLDELWSRNLINLFSTPIAVGEYMTGLILVNLLKAIAGMGAAALIAWAAYAFDIVPWLMSLMPFMVALVLFALALGVVITGLIFRYTTRIQGLAWSFAGLLNPISCVIYPLRSLPRWLQWVAWMLPTTHAFEAMRQMMTGGAFPMRHLYWAFGLDAAYFCAALFAFRIIFESARSRGLLVKIE